MMTKADCQQRDAADPLAELRHHFSLGQVDRDRIVYLDGNSLGALPKRATIHLMHVTEQEWGSGLIRSWNTAGWMTLSQTIGDKIATLIGAGPGEVMAVPVISEIASVSIVISGGVGSEYTMSMGGGV